MGTLPVLEIDRPEFWQDIHSGIANARAASKVAETTEAGLYVLGQPEIEAVLKDPKFEAADLLAMMGLRAGPVWEWWSRLMFSNNDPIHSRLRRLVARAFTPRRIERERENVRALADSLVRSAIDQGEVDVMTTVAHELPAQAIAELFRIPDEDRHDFAQWTTDVGLAFGAAVDPGIRARVEDALRNLDEYASELVEQRRQAPLDDLLSDLIAVEEEGDRLSTRELVDLVENLLFAGHDTTRGSLGALVWLLVDNPSSLTTLRNEPDLVPNAVEESLRYEAITFSTARTATEATSIDGVAIDAGTTVGVCLPGGSRDPRVYPEPDTFDVRRRDPRPPTFGAGAHYCIGASLARVELQEFLRAVLAETRGVEAMNEPRWVPFAHIRRYERFDVRLLGR